MAEDYQCLEVRPIAGALGAEIQGVDLASPLESEVLREVQRAFLAHLVIFFQEQELPPEKLLSFARQLGEPMEYPQMRGLPGFPLITPVIKRVHERVNFGGVWHSDTAYLERPPSATMLYAVEVPPSGGDTLFANQYLAYETLSPGLKEAIDPLIGVNTSAKAQISETREDRLREADETMKVMISKHPVVRTHPETGRRALYVNLGHTLHFQGWPQEESRPLLDYLFRPQVKPEFTCRFRWLQRSLALWDNRCTLHNPVNDYQGYKRVMHRITLAGDKPLP